MGSDKKLDMTVESSISWVDGDINVWIPQMDANKMHIEKARR